MALVNEHLLKLPDNYLFTDLAKKVNTFKVTHPKADIINQGIGDVTRPIPQSCLDAMHKALEDQAKAETFHGYGPEQGYSFLIDAIIKHDYASRGISLEQMTEPRQIPETLEISSDMTTVSVLQTLYIRHI